MKCLALVFVVAILTGCSTTEVYRPTKNGDFYAGGSGSTGDQFSVGDSLRSAREAQINGGDRVLLNTFDSSIVKGHSFHLLLGYQVAEMLDLEATLHTNGLSPLTFSSRHTLEDQSIQGSPSARIHSVRVDGELEESGVMLSALVNWRFREHFTAFARLGGSYSETTLESELERDLGTDKFINQVEYRAEAIKPVLGIGVTISDVVRFEYQARNVPIGSTAPKVRTSPTGTFDAAEFSDEETFHALMITIRFGLKNFFGNESDGSRR